MIWEGSTVVSPLNIMLKVSRGQRIRDAFFTRAGPDSDDWICVCSTKLKNSGTGYTNLVSHVEVHHASDLLALDCHESMSSLQS